MRRPAAAVTHLMQTRQGYERRELLQEFQRGQCDAGGAIGPGACAGGEEVAVGVDVEAFQRYRAPGGRTSQPFGLIAAVGRHVRVGMEGKAVDAGTASPRQGWALPFRAKA